MKEYIKITIDDLRDIIDDEIKHHTYKSFSEKEVFVPKEMLQGAKIEQQSN